MIVKGIHSPSETFVLLTADQYALNTTRSHRTKSNILVSKLHSGTSKNNAPDFVLEVPLHERQTTAYFLGAMMASLKQRCRIATFVKKTHISSDSKEKSESSLQRRRSLRNKLIGS